MAQGYISHGSGTIGQSRSHASKNFNCSFFFNRSQISIDNGMSNRTAQMKAPRIDSTSETHCYAFSLSCLYVVLSRAVCEGFFPLTL